MAKNNCQLKISYEDGLLVARLCGELDHHSAVAVRTLIDSEIKKHSPTKAVLDMKDLDFMDSSGIGLIMGRFALMESLGENSPFQTLTIGSLKYSGLQVLIAL